MTEKDTADFNPYLFNLITMFAQSAWCQLGKVPSPIDNKITKDLKSAKMTIDMLLMIRDKMRGNLTKKEEDVISATISELQLNYADEAAKGDSKTENAETEQQDCGCGGNNEHSHSGENLHSSDCGCGHKH